VGVLGRGYVIGSEQAYERLQRKLKAYTVVSLVLIIATAALQQYFATLIVAALLIAFYLVWTRYLLRGLQPSDESLSLQDSMTFQARVHNLVVLWLLEIGALAFVAGGIFILVIDPGNWLIALASIVFFGICAGVFMGMLVLRRRAQIS
jgi:MFS superfamily sulfate permease-like transporter